MPIVHAVFGIFASLIHRLDFALERLRDQVALEFSVCRQQAAFDGERLRHHVESSHLLVVRQRRIHQIERLLRLFTAHLACNQRRQISAALPISTT